MARHMLSDVNVVALSVVNKGANGKRFYLRKQEDVDEETLLTLPAPHRLVKAGETWDTVYCVVAEPEWEEGPGVGAGADSAVPDVWASPEEIRKAAHRFMSNGHLVNRMHESLEPYGDLVENFVAQTTYSLNGEMIKAGSWVVGIKLNDDGRTAVEKGEFTGVSIQGDGLRTLVEKADTRYGGKGTGPRKKQAGRLAGKGKKVHEIAATMGTDAGTVKRLLAKVLFDADPEGDDAAEIVKRLGPGGDIARNQGVQFGPLRHLIKFYLGKAHPFTSCVRDNRKRFGPRAEAVCAALKDIGLQTTKWRSGGKKSMAKADGDAVAELWDGAVEAWHGRGLSDDDATEAIKGLRAADRANRQNGGTVRKAVKKLAERLGVSEEELGLDDIEKAQDMPTFDEIIAERELEDELPKAFEALRCVVYRAFNPYPADSETDPREVISQSLTEFKAWALDVLDRLPIQKRQEIADLVQADGAGTVGADHPADEEDDVDRIEELEKAQKTQADEIGELRKGVSTLLERVPEPEAKAPTADELRTGIEKLQGEVAKLTKGIEALAEGDTSLDDDYETEPGDRKQVAKSDPLAGILG